MGHPRPPFSLFLSFQTNIRIEKTSIQDMVRGFEPTNFGT